MMVVFPVVYTALLRRATANETLERYLDAYTDYRHVTNLDSSAANAFTGATRLACAYSCILHGTYTKPPLLLMLRENITLAMSVVLLLIHFSYRCRFFRPISVCLLS